MIQVIDSSGVVNLVKQSLDLDSRDVHGAQVEPLVFEVLRRTAGFYCPCSPHTLMAVLDQSLFGLFPSSDAVQGLAEQAIEALIAGGDLIEAARVVSGDDRAKQTYLYLAPPSFVIYPSGLVRIVGLAPEETTPLPRRLRQRIRWAGPARFLEPLSGEDLAGALEDVGFHRSSFESWLRLPPTQSSLEYRKQIDNAIDIAKPSGDVANLRIFDIDQGSRFYTNGWKTPTAETGMFVCRRPQGYGADLWGAVLLEQGRPKRLVDFPLLLGSHRGCDEAWRFLLALFNESGHPRACKVYKSEAEAVIAFGFPIPLWAQRRLEVVGFRTVSPASIFAYSLPEDALESELRFLKTTLWMQSHDE